MRVRIQLVLRRHHPGWWKHPVSAVSCSVGLSDHSCATNNSDSLIQQQMNVLNNDYARTGLSWRLAGVDRTINSQWANGLTDGSSQEAAMKKTLRKGGVADLNVYTVV